MTAEGSPKTEDTNCSVPVVMITEFLVIAIINAITITAFIKNCHLRKCSTYLIINLTVADLLVGAVTGPLLVYFKQDCSWPGLRIYALHVTFPIASQLSLSLISLERLHATPSLTTSNCVVNCQRFEKILARKVTAPTMTKT